MWYQVVAILGLMMACTAFALADDQHEMVYQQGKPNKTEILIQMVVQLCSRDPVFIATDKGKKLCDGIIVPTEPHSIIPPSTTTSSTTSAETTPNNPMTTTPTSVAPDCASSIAQDGRSTITWIYISAVPALLVLAAICFLIHHYTKRTIINPLNEI